MGLTGGKVLANSDKEVAVKRLDNKTVVISGCSSGIGKVAARELYKLGARVVMACRDMEKAEKALEEIKTTVNQSKGVGELVLKKLDLSSLVSVCKCAKSILETESHIEILINNAGVKMCPYALTEDGFEMQFGTNHLGHFLFTCLLLPKIISSAPSRIITVSSVSHKRGQIDFDDLELRKKPYSALGAYRRSKLANVLFSNELSRRLKDTRVTTYALYPGLVRSDLNRHLDKTYFFGAGLLYSIAHYFFSKPLDQGAETILYCALDEKAGSETGLYYSECKVAEQGKLAQDEELAKRLWEVSAKLTGVNFDPFKPDTKRELFRPPYNA